MAAKKGGLGKGLDSLLVNKVNADHSSDSTIVKEKSTTTKKKSTKKETPDTMVKLSLVEPNREQPRKHFDEDGLLELAESIKQYGILQPLLVQEKSGYYEIIAGERRWRAAKLAGLKEIPVIVRNLTEQQIVEISLIENIQREDLNPIEEAQAFRRLMEEFHMKQDEIADRVSKSRTAVTNSMRLLKLSKQVQQMVIDEMISTGHARCLISIEDPELQHQLALRIFDEKLSVRETEKLVRKLLQENNAPQKKINDPVLSAIYADLADLGVTAVLDAGATANSTAKANGIAVVAAGSGWDSVGCLNLTFTADGSMTAEPASMSAADLKSARGSYTTAQQTAYDSAFTSLQSLADGDEDVRSQTLFTFEANESADKTISFANYAAALYLAYADGDRANCPQDAADLTVTALAGGITELDFGDVTRGALCDAVPDGQRLVLARTTSVAIGALIDTGTVTRTYEESLTAFEPTDGDALVVTDTATLEALEQAGGSYTILRDYGDVFWDIRMNINDVTNNFANPFTLPEAPQRGAGRK